jgi:hypothetical protein
MQISEFKNLIANMPVPYQAFTSKKTTWNKYIDEKNGAGEALRSIFGNSDKVTISRSDLSSLAQKQDLEQFIMATIIWGYPRGMRGNHVADLIRDFDKLIALLSDARKQPVQNWNAHFKKVGNITGIGLSTYTKFLTFMSAQIHDHSALILDERIIKVAKQEIFKELKMIRGLKTNNAARYYPSYLSCIHTIANELDLSAEKIEFFIFEFGLNLKPLPLPK